MSDIKSIFGLPLSSSGGGNFKLISEITCNGETCFFEETFDKTYKRLVFIINTSVAQGAGYVAIGLNGMGWSNANSLKYWNPTSVSKIRFDIEVFNEGVIYTYGADSTIKGFCNVCKDTLCVNGINQYDLRLLQAPAQGDKIYILGC